MWLIVRNGMRRWWWVYLLASAGCLFAVIDNDAPALKAGIMAGVIIYAGVMLFAFEVGGYPKFRAFNLLPVSAMQRGRGFEILFAGVVPAICIAAYLLGAVVHLLAPKLVPPPVSGLLYTKVVFFTTGGVCLFVQISQWGGRFTRGWQKLVWSIGSALITLFIFVLTVYFVYRFGLPPGSKPLPPEHPFARWVNGIANLIGSKEHLLDPPECIALGIAAVSIALAAFKADSFNRFIMSLRREDMNTPVFSTASTRTYGFYEPWVLEIQAGATFIGVIALCIGFLELLFWAVSGQPPLSGWTFAHWPLVLVVITGLVSVPPIIPWFAGLRALRMLPFSRQHLALYLISFPLMAFTAYSVILIPVCTWFRGLDYAINLEWWLVVAFGLSMLTNSLLLLSKNAFVSLVFLFVPVVAISFLVLWLDDPMALVRQTPLLHKTGLGIALFALGYLGLSVTITRNTPYHNKSWFGG